MTPAFGSCWFGSSMWRPGNTAAIWNWVPFFSTVWKKLGPLIFLVFLLSYSTAHAGTSYFLNTGEEITVTFKSNGVVFEYGATAITSHEAQFSLQGVPNQNYSSFTHSLDISRYNQGKPLENRFCLYDKKPFTLTIKANSPTLFWQIEPGDINQCNPALRNTTTTKKPRSQQPKEPQPQPQPQSSGVGIFVFLLVFGGGGYWCWTIYKKQMETTGRSGWTSYSSTESARDQDLHIGFSLDSVVANIQEQVAKMKTETKCAACGAQVQPPGKFCDMCGALLEATPGNHTHPAQQMREIVRYITDQILASSRRAIAAAERRVKETQLLIECYSNALDEQLNQAGSYLGGCGVEVPWASTGSSFTPEKTSSYIANFEWLLVKVDKEVMPTVEGHIGQNATEPKSAEIWINSFKYRGTQEKPVIVQEATWLVESLRKMQRPSGWGAAIGTFILALVARFVITAALEQLSKGVADAIGGFLFFAAIAAAIVAGLVRHFGFSTIIRNRYLEISQGVNKAKTCLQSWLDQTRTQCQEELTKLQNALAPLVERTQYQISEFKESTGLIGAAWTEPAWRNWGPPESPATAIRLGTLMIDAIGLQTSLPALDLQFSLPALIPFASGSSLLVKATGQGKDRAVKAIESSLLRLLATLPPGKLRFTFIDPVGLGQNVAAFMPLADYDESLLNSKAWTEPAHIEQRLADLTEHMETVIQKYLRKDYSTIEDYNNQAGEVAEPYRILVVVDFPVNFSDVAARRLVSIAQNGPRCGVYAFVVMDTEKPLPYGFNLEDLERGTIVIGFDGPYCGILNDNDFRACLLELDQPPPESLFSSVLTTTGEIAKDAMKVEVPYTRLLQLSGMLENAWWQGTTVQKISVPLGPTGARKLQYLNLGEGTGHHVLVVGRPGSGKSNLMHVLITTLAICYPPEEIELYMIDFKKGVEFKPYADLPLPHARVIAIESEREFGLSVIQGLDAELQRRGELFRAAAVNSITEYREKSGIRMPRILLLVDEFQEFFTQDDNISRQAALVLDRLVRQGRAFGIHVLLGSQTLAGSYTLARSTLDQMAIRVALQCSDTDSRLILADDNAAARSLSRPGEAIYNAASGLVEGNNPFQVGLFTDEDRVQYLNAVAGLAKTSGKTLRVPIVFEGHEPARLETCRPLGALLTADNWPAVTNVADAWLGEPIAIQPPTVARFRRQSGSHLLVVTRDEAEGVGVLAAAVISLAVQQPPEAARFFILDLTVADSPWADLAEDMADLLPHQIEVLGRRDLPGLLTNLNGIIRQRLETEQAQGSRFYLVIQGLHRARDLRREEGESKFGFDTQEGEKISTPPEQFVALLREGPEVGVHVLAWSDTYANVMRVLDRRVLGEFSMRCAGAMSNDDSMNFIDDPSAAQLGKPHRMIFFDEERPGVVDKFRPYAIPGTEWLKSVAHRLRTRLAAE